MRTWYYLADICGEADFRCRRKGNARLPAAMAGILQTQKAGYPLDRGAFWLSDKFQIRALTYNSSLTEKIYFSQPYRAKLAKKTI